MNIPKKNYNELIARWLKWDGELWATLRPIQIKLLKDRIIHEMSFYQMAKANQSTETQIKKIFLAILLKLKQSHGNKIVALLHFIHCELEKQECGKLSKHGVTYENICLN